MEKPLLLITLFVTIFAISLFAQEDQLILGDDTAEFEIESIRILVYPVKEDGSCWDNCTGQSIEKNIAYAKVLQNQHIEETGTQEAESKLNVQFPTVTEMLRLFDAAKQVIGVVADATQLPEIRLELRSVHNQVLRYPFNARDRFYSVFSNPTQKIRLSHSRYDRNIFVNVYDVDILDDDPIGYKKIMVGDRVYNSGGVILVQFDQVHFLQLILRRVNQEGHGECIGFPPDAPECKRVN